MEPLEELITNRRRERMVSRAEIAKKLGIRDIGFIGMVENGARRYPLRRLPALAKLLELDPRELIRIWCMEHAPEVLCILFPDDDGTIYRRKSGNDLSFDRDPRDE